MVPRRGSVDFRRPSIANGIFDQPSTAAFDAFGVGLFVAAGADLVSTERGMRTPLLEAPMNDRDWNYDEITEEEARLRRPVCEMIRVASLAHGERAAPSLPGGKTQQWMRCARLTSRSKAVAVGQSAT